VAKKRGTNARSQLDFFAEKAKKEGYPARSVYKLQEIQEKFRIIAPGFHVLDIGAAPGSWTLYVHRKLLRGSGSIVAADLKPLSLNPLPPGVTTIIGDAFAEPQRTLIRDKGPYQAVISDAAPSTTGSSSLDTLRSQALAESILALLPDVLVPEGSLTVKLFQGGGEQELLRAIRERFRQAKAFKPKACRKDSFEIYLIGLGYRTEPQCSEHRTREEPYEEN
jgi:23S rRNA (uridine2552-2'-O)-methyltransferase